MAAKRRIKRVHRGRLANSKDFNQAAADLRSFNDYMQDLGAMGIGESITKRFYSAANMIFKLQKQHKNGRDIPKTVLDRLYDRASAATDAAANRLFRNE
jgi:hypothetical protein